MTATLSNGFLAHRRKEGAGLAWRCWRCLRRPADRADRLQPPLPPAFITERRAAGMAAGRRGLRFV